MYFPEIKLTLFNVANIRLSRILHKTLSIPSFKSACVLKRENILETPSNKY